MDAFYEESAVNAKSKSGAKKYKVAHIFSIITLILGILFLSLFIMYMPWSIQSGASADQLAHTRDATVMIDRDLRSSVCILNHGAEFVNAKLLAILRHPNLSIKHRPRRIQLDGNCQNQIHRPKQSQSANGHNKIKHSFQKQADLFLFEDVVIPSDLLCLHLQRELLPWNDLHLYVLLQNRCVLRNYVLHILIRQAGM